ncbi:MAG TPA: hypothetical protein VF681_04790 [Abditibacteriaceae bacterium]|jgi:hypothetical protein
MIQNILPLFQKGNVIVKGIQGSGKSMLLALLKPEIRAAYQKRGVEFPLPAPLHNFISGGINFITSAATEFGQRPLEDDRELNSRLLPLYLADFVNYWVTRDLLNSLVDLSVERNGSAAHELGLMLETSNLDKFAIELSSDPCWFGALDDTRNFHDLQDKLRDRIVAYRSFLAFNSPLPDQIRHTKTAIGLPMSMAAEYLYAHEIVPRSVPFFVWYDQYEQLTYLDHVGGNLGLDCQNVINKSLTRDERVSYKICTRPYGWPDSPAVFSDQSVLEVERDYKIVDITQILRRGENNLRSYIFPAFAEDIFKRRLIKSGYKVGAKSLRAVFGKGASVDERLKQYGASGSQVRRISKDPDIPSDWKRFLSSIAEKDPLDSKLAEAWYRQQSRRCPDLKIPDEPYPWIQRVYWRKERIRQAMMQLATQGSQRMVWSGYEDILRLSGGNVLVFVSICQHIWDEWSKALTAEPTNSMEETGLPYIDPSIQVAGIDIASKHWHKKITGSTGRSARRQEFLDYIGRHLRHLLLSDESMSYPGRNGFSIRLDELQQDGKVYDFLKEAVDYGDLVDAIHTTKSADKRPRRKYYPNPVLSPYYQLPVTHVKEPLYISLRELRVWIEVLSQNTRRDNPLPLNSRERTQKASASLISGQTSLFGLDEENE